MKLRTLFLSHAPHDVHKTFANAVDARIHIIPFDGFVKIVKRLPLLRYIYPFVSAIYSLTIEVNEDVLIADGGSSLFTAIALKKRYGHVKLIYLDGDLLFYNLNKHRLLRGRDRFKFLDAIDGVISVSEENMKYVFLDVPKAVCTPYPKKLSAEDKEKKNYGLYVGRLDPDKNIKRIIEFGLQCPHFEKMYVVGDGTQRSYVERLAKQNSKLMYAGQQKNVEKYYNMCKFLVHIPDHDPHPTTTMEAAFCGCFPIVSKGVGSNYFFDNIFIVEDLNDVAEINSKIQYILEHEEQAKFLLEESVAKIPKKIDSVHHFSKSFSEIVNKLKT